MVQGRRVFPIRTKIVRLRRAVCLDVGQGRRLGLPPAGIFGESKNEFSRFQKYPGGECRRQRGQRPLTFFSAVRAGNPENVLCTVFIRHACRDEEPVREAVQIFDGGRVYFFHRGKLDGEAFSAAGDGAAEV